MTPETSEPKTYQIRIRGQLSYGVVSALGATREADSGTSILVVEEDHSAITRLEDLALELTSVTQVGKDRT